MLTVNSLFLELTYRCNLHCRMCYYHGRSGFMRADMLSAKKENSIVDIERLLVQLKTYSNISTVILTGGESLLYTDVIEIIRLVKRHEMKCILLTNATLINSQLANQIVLSGLDEIKISLDGTENIHDDIRCHQQSFLKTRQAIANILESRNNLNLDTPEITLGYTISARNLGILGDLIKIIANWKVSIDVLHLMWLDATDIHKQKNIMMEQFGVQDITADGFLNSIHELNTSILYDDIVEAQKIAQKNDVKLSISHFADRHTLETWYNTNNLINGSCLFFHNALRVNPYGDIMPCQFIRYPYGNIKKDELLNVWYGEKRDKFLKYSAQNNFPICKRCCKRRINS